MKHLDIKPSFTFYIYIYIYIIKRSQEIYILFDSIDRVSMVMMMDVPKADGQWGFHHNQSEVSADFYEKSLGSQNFLPFPDLHWDNLQETSIFFHIYIYCIYIYIYIHRHKPCFSVDFMDATTPTSAWPPDRCSVPCVSTVAVLRPVPRSLPVRRNGETWWFYAWTMNSTINAVCDSDKKYSNHDCY